MRALTEKRYYNVLTRNCCCFQYVVLNIIDFVYKVGTKSYNTYTKTYAPRNVDNKAIPAIIFLGLFRGTNTRSSNTTINEIVCMQCCVQNGTISSIPRGAIKSRSLFQIRQNSISPNCKNRINKSKLLI